MLVYVVVVVVILFLLFDVDYVSLIVWLVNLMFI